MPLQDLPGMGKQKPMILGQTFLIDSAVGFVGALFMFANHFNLMDFGGHTVIFPWRSLRSRYGVLWVGLPAFFDYDGHKKTNIF